MGNSAIRSCTTVSTSVRLLQADGKVLEFADPVLAIRVMQDYPGHTVVRYNASAGTRPPSSSSFAAGTAGSSSSSNHQVHRELHPLEEAAIVHGCKFPIASQPQPIRKVAILRADEELQPGNTYYLLPVHVPRHQATSAQTSSKKQTLKFPKSSSKVGSSYEYEPERRSEKKSHKVLRRSSSMPHPRELQLRMQQQHTQQAQQAVAVSYTAPLPMPRQSLGRLLMEGRSSSLGSNGASSSSQQQNSLQLQMQETFDMLECRSSRWKPQSPRTPRTRKSLQNIGWKPVLESIPECRPPEFQPRAFLPSYNRSRSTPMHMMISQAVH